MSGASKVEASLVNRIKKVFNSGVCISFGQTETHGGITETHPDDTVEDTCNSLGQPFPLIGIKIVDPETDKILPLNTVGEICTQGYVNMVGYYGMPEETAKTIRDGWLHTGDLGSMDERGFLFFEGRLKDMIVRGGENVYPAEVEALLKENSKIRQVAVVGIPHPVMGEEVAAVIIPKSLDNLPSPKDLHDFCRTNLTHFKTPRIWGFTDEFEYTATGKLQKFKLQEKIVNGKLKVERT